MEFPFDRYQDLPAELRVMVNNEHILPPPREDLMPTDEIIEDFTSELFNSEFADASEFAAVNFHAMSWTMWNVRFHIHLQDVVDAINRLLEWHWTCRTNLLAQQEAHSSTTALKWALKDRIRRVQDQRRRFWADMEEHERIMDLQEQEVIDEHELLEAMYRQQVNAVLAEGQQSGGSVMRQRLQECREEHEQRVDEFEDSLENETYVFKAVCHHGHSWYCRAVSFTRDFWHDDMLRHLELEIMVLRFLASDLNGMLQAARQTRHPMRLEFAVFRIEGAQIGFSREYMTRGQGVLRWDSEGVVEFIGPAHLDRDVIEAIERGENHRS